MADIKLTKNELRLQQNKLGQLTKYLPTLQLKKAMLQIEVNEVRIEIGKFEKKYIEARSQVGVYSSLLSQHIGLEMPNLAKVSQIQRRYENIAGVDTPLYEGVVFEPIDYSLFESPPWIDAAIKGLQYLAETRAELIVAMERKEALEKELREVSIRVNLFEKNLIPKAMANIKKIRIFLGDQQLAAVSQAKVAKTKIEERKEAKRALLLEDR
jgi:V/A-type H+/Na+-transporting ATPase subunit D